jgi:hypothetical protein
MFLISVLLILALVIISINVDRQRGGDGRGWFWRLFGLVFFMEEPADEPTPTTPTSWHRVYDALPRELERQPPERPINTSGYVTLNYGDPW